MSALNKESTIQQKRKPGVIAGGANNFNSRRSNHNNTVRDSMYKITAFEEEMDYEAKRKARFDIKKYR